jgi:hypothetical protein
MEKFPLSIEIIRKMNYPALLGSPAAELFHAIHGSPWDVPVRIGPMMELIKIRDDFVTAPLAALPVCNLVYYDAFSPEKQPEMWEPALFRKLYAKMGKGGVFVTYCARGAVRRDLERAGFRMERLPGPPGKREILRGIKPLCD